MTVGFDPSSATLTTLPYEALDPEVGIPVAPISGVGDFLVDAFLLVQGMKAVFRSSVTGAHGAVELTGTKGENAAGWELGFLQVEVSETNFGRYQANWKDGSAAHGGSILAQLGEAPARPKQACRDTGGNMPAADVWYNRKANKTGSAGAFPQKLTAWWADQTNIAYPAVLWNSVAKQPNFLHDVKIVLNFCTALALREPGGRFHILKHFFWSVGWRATFEPADFKDPMWGPWLPPMVIKQPTGAVSPSVIDGPPRDKDIRDLLTNTTEKDTCNDLVRNAAVSVFTSRGYQEEKDRDHHFDVR